MPPLGDQVTPRGLEAQTLSARDRELVKRYLGNPLEFPAIFKGWLETYIDPLVREIVGTAIGRVPVYTPANTVTIAAAPPTSPTPVTGDRWIDVANGWEFVYDSTEATYKWKFAGGAPIVVAVDTQENAPNGVWGNCATNGPLYTVPRAGDYAAAASVNASNTGGGTNPLFGLAIGDTTPSPQMDGWTSGTGDWVVLEQKRKFTGLSASDVIKIRYWGAAISVQFKTRAMMVWPIKVI